MTTNQAFHRGETEAQVRWHTTALWDQARKQRLLWDLIPPDLHARIEAAPFFFLATSDDEGRCDCSFKGGGPGLIKILDERRFVFPDFAGNGAFMSLGNILVNPRVGCLFIDFSDGGRLRVNGRAAISEDAALLGLFAGAERAVVVSVEQVVPNCAQHVPRLAPVAGDQIR